MINNLLVWTLCLGHKSLHIDSYVLGLTFYRKHLPGAIAPSKAMPALNVTGYCAKVYSTLT